MIWLKRLAIAFAALLAAAFALDRIFPPPLERGDVVSVMVTDRDGRPLRAIPTPEHHWRFRADLDEIDPVFVEALLEVEDQRFWSHGGVDWTGMVRAVWSSALAGRVVSGGSTITMQTVKNLYLWQGRSYLRKLLEAPLAVMFDLVLPKKRIMIASQNLLLKKRNKIASQNLLPKKRNRIA